MHCGTLPIMQSLFRPNYCEVSLLECSNVTCYFSPNFTYAKQYRGFLKVHLGQLLKEAGIKQVNQEKPMEYYFFLKDCLPWISTH